MYENTIAIAIRDISAAIKQYDLPGMLGWQDIRQRYRRSALGPFWLTVSMGVMIATIGIVFGQIFSMPMSEYLPYLTAGMILWGFISTVITEGCTSFIAAEGIIKQLPIPLFTHIMRMMWRNTLILGHNIVILPLVFLATQRPITMEIFLVIPGFLLTLISLGWMALSLGVVCTRYRDLPQIVASILQIAFYLTPIMWMPSLLPERLGTGLIDLNPIFHIMELVRAPLLGRQPTVENWIIATGIAIIGWGITFIIYGKYKRRIAYWL